MEIKVRELSGVEEKSTQQIEEELLQKHEEELNSSQEFSDVEASEEDAKENVEETQTSELSEDDVLSYIKNRYNKELSSVEQLFDERESSEELPEDVKAYFEYKKKTGRGMDDYIKLSKDFSSMDEDQLLSEYFIASGDALDDDDVDVLMDEYSYDEEYDDEKEIKKKKLVKKKKIAEAKKYFEEQKEMYRQPLESSTVGISEEQQKEIEAYKQYLAEAKTTQEEVNRKREWFLEKSNEVFNDFKGFDFKIGDSTLTFNPTGDVSKLKEEQTNSMSFVAKYLDPQTGLIKDANGYHRALAVAMNPEKFAKFFYEQGKAEATENVTRKMKNIDMSERRAPEVTKSKDGLSIRALSQPEGRGLKIKSKNR